MRKATKQENTTATAQAGPLLSRRVAMFPNAFAKGKPRIVTLRTLLEAVRNGRYASHIERLRETLRRDRAAYDQQKRTLPAFCMSGTALSRTQPDQHSGLIQVDLDDVGRALADIRERLESDKHVAFAFVSPSGNGLKAAVAIDGQRHQESFHAVEEYFLEEYGVQIDEKCKDPLRLCFVSNDPTLWINENATPLPICGVNSADGHNGEHPKNPSRNGEHGQEDKGEGENPNNQIVILPSGNVSISESAASIFQRVAPMHRLFYRGGALVELVEEDGVSRLAVVDAEAFRSRVEKVGRIVAWRVGEDGKQVLKPTKMPQSDAKALIATEEARDLLPKVANVLKCAALVEAQAGSLHVLGRGYHSELGGLLILAGEMPPEVPLTEAVAALNRLVEEFDFVTPADRSRALAAFITPALRIGGFLSGPVPIDVAEADQSQAGKGYRHKLVRALYNEAGYFVTSRQGGVGSKDESFAAALIAGRPFVVLDNLRGRIDSQHLEAFMTCPDLFPARIPHCCEVLVNPRRFLIQLSSNGVEATRDLANRSSIVRIRKRPGYLYRDTSGEIEARPAYFLGCVFAIVRAWIVAGKRRTPCASHDFREWAGTLDWIVQDLLGAAPLMEGHENAQERVSNPALSWLRLVAHAVEHAGRLGQRLAAGDIVDLCELHGIEVPGASPSASEDQFRRQAGVLMRRVFREADQVEIDSFTARRATELQSRGGLGGPLTIKLYTFAKR